MLNSNNSTENYGRRWARIRYRGDLYSQESNFPLVCSVLISGCEKRIVCTKVAKMRTPMDPRDGAVR